MVVRPQVYVMQARLTIPPRQQIQAEDAQALSLRALGWILSDGDRAGRFLSLTGLTPDGLRAALGDAGTLVAVLDFLCAHEPDLVDAAQALDVAPAELAAARERIGA